jgi:uncharacterized protein (TIGR00369 family)
MSMLSLLEPGLTGLQQLRALIATGRQPSIHETLSIALVSVEEGHAVVEAMPGAAHLNPAGIVHGGYAATMLDTACGCAVHSALPTGTGFVTLELKVSYHRPLTSQTGKVHADGRLLSMGRTAAFAEAYLQDETGKLIASATSSLLVLPLKPQ